MTIRWLVFVLVPLALDGHLKAAESPADRLRPPTGRIEMVLDSDMFNEVADQFALAFAVRSPQRIDLKAVYAAPFLNHRSKSAGDGMEKSYQETSANKKQPRSGPNAWQKVIWDIATIAWLLEPETMVTSQMVPSPVLTDEGTWKPGDGRHAIRVAVKLDRERIFSVLFQRLGKS